MRILVATRSRPKLREIREILGAVEGLEIVAPDEAGLEPAPAEEGLEPHDTFEENAVSKARYFAARSGLPALADDSGLVVDALGGAPGVRSSRFAGAPGRDPGERDRANNRRLLELLRDVPEERRTARYVCVAALATPGGEVWTFRGEAEGRILVEPRGEGGFGYDPLFYDPELGRTFAEVSPGEKHRRSHRGKAFRAAADFLREWTGRGRSAAGGGPPRSRRRQP